MIVNICAFLEGCPDAAYNARVNGLDADWEGNNPYYFEGIIGGTYIDGNLLVQLSMLCHPRDESDPRWRSVVLEGRWGGGQQITVTNIDWVYDPAHPEGNNYSAQRFGYEATALINPAAEIAEIAPASSQSDVVQWPPHISNEMRALMVVAGIHTIDSCLPHARTQ